MSVRVTVNGASTLSGSICAPGLPPLLALLTLQEFRGRIDFLKRCNKRKKNPREKQQVSEVEPPRDGSIQRGGRRSLLLAFPFPCWWPRWPRWGSVNSWLWPCTPPALYPIGDTRRARSGATCCTSRWRCRSGWTRAAEQPGKSQDEGKKQKLNINSCYWVTDKHGTFRPWWLQFKHKSSAFDLHCPNLRLRTNMLRSFELVRGKKIVPEELIHLTGMLFSCIKKWNFLKTSDMNHSTGELRV